METKKTGKFNLIISVVLVVIAIALAALTFYFYKQYQNIKKNPNQVAQAEIDATPLNKQKAILHTLQLPDFELGRVIEVKKA